MPNSATAGLPHATDDRAIGRSLLALILAAAMGHQLFLLATTDFPINDGGLFLNFIEALAKSFPTLPATVSFNGLDIPFAYPPLSFWIGALLTRLGADPIAILRILPIAINALYVLLFALVLRRSGRSPLFTAMALLFFCTALRSFEWLVMGGGLSRGSGALFLMLGLLAIGVPEAGRRDRLPARRLIVAGAAVAGAILSHLEWGIDAAAAIVLARMLGSADIKEFLRSTVIPGAVALLLILPWLLTIYLTHGIAPLLAAGGSSPWDLQTLGGHLLWIVASSLENPLVAVGLALLTMRRDFFWPLFLIVVLALTPKHGPTPAMLAIAVSAAAGLLWVLAELRRRVGPAWVAPVAAATLAALLIVPRLGSDHVAQGRVLRPLKADERRAMAWVARNHPGDSFLVLTQRPWWYDSSAEWFPALANARSVNTLQGREWLPDRAYAIWFERDRARRLARSCPELLASLAAYERPNFIWAEARQECFREPNYRQVHRDGEVTIFRLAPA